MPKRKWTTAQKRNMAAKAKARWALRKSQPVDDAPKAANHETIYVLIDGEVRRLTLQSIPVFMPVLPQ